MAKAKPRKTKVEPLFKAEDSTPRGIILERFKRIKQLPSRPLDLVSSFFVQRYLRTKRNLF